MHLVQLLLTAVATTEVGVSGAPRPIAWLELMLPCLRDVFASAALLAGLTHLQVEINNTDPQ